ncbi:hypothetical protein F2Q69_00021084 [Brassica cretica]|uniref:Uncharacterized protein n=1 Tax=Brassica cretica TaxID=69181 RepID=A0A8S9Q6Z9_BRACR|nr:hypothetical protein F2Q69_00021084 [Brassica cretica]
MKGDRSGSSRRRQNSGRKLCFCGLEAALTKAWTDKNPGRRFYGCSVLSRKMDASSSHGLMKRTGHYGKKRALIEAQDEI